MWKERVSQRSSACHLSGHWFRERGSYLALCSYAPVNDSVDRAAISACRAYTVFKFSPLTQAHYTFNFSWDSHTMVHVFLLFAVMISTFNAFVLSNYVIIGCHVVWNWGVLPLVAYPISPSVKKFINPLIHTPHVRGFKSFHLRSTSLLTIKGETVIIFMVFWWGKDPAGSLQTMLWALQGAQTQKHTQKHTHTHTHTQAHTAESSELLVNCCGNFVKSEMVSTFQTH